jgi:hypothetical protein
MMSVATVAARGEDVGERLEVELNDGRQRLSGGAVGEGLGQGLMPCGVLGLQGEEFGDGVTPALGPGAPVLGPTITDDRWRLFGCEPAR